MSELTLTSTTDSQEAVNAALGIEPEIVTPEVKEPETEPEPETPEADESDSSEVEDQADVEPEPAKKKGGFQKKIDKLTAETYQLAAEKAELQRQLAAHTAAKPAEPAKPEATEGEPKVENFDDYAKYIRAVAKYDLQQELAAQRQQEREQAQAAERNKAQAQFNKRTDTARGKYEDFDQVISNPNLQISQVMYDVIVNSDDGAELGYYLGKNPAEAARIAALHPIAAARELGKLEAKITKPVTATDAVKPKVTTAPAPIKPVGTKPATSSKSPDEMDYQEYKKWRNSNN